MQPSAGPALPHSRSRTVHWVATAAALGAVVAAVALVQPADASSSGRAGDSGAKAPAGSAAPVPPPDPAAVTYPLGCGAGVATDVVSEVSGDLDGDGRPETVAVVRCHADNGTPPSGVFVLGATGPAGAPKIVETLVRPQDKRDVLHFRLEGRTVRATVLGYSSDQTPRCCPDLMRAYSWEWRDGRYVAIPGGPSTNA